MKGPISTIEDLIHELLESNADECKKVVKRLAIPMNQFKQYEHWEEGTYTRNCIFRTDNFELILLCWDKLQETAIHCHNEQECWVYVLKGEFEEERYQSTDNGLEIEQELDLMEEGVSYMNDNMGYHKLKNVVKDKAMSLHLYMNPIDSCSIYNEETEGFESKDLEYDTFQGELVESESVIR